MAVTNAGTSGAFSPACRWYALGLMVAVYTCDFVGGGISEAFDWRAAFVVVGIPGVVRVFEAVR
jgi:MFS family permease